MEGIVRQLHGECRRPRRLRVLKHTSRSREVRRNGVDREDVAPATVANRSIVGRTQIKPRAQIIRRGVCRRFNNPALEPRWEHILTCKIGANGFRDCVLPMRVIILFVTLEVSQPLIGWLCLRQQHALGQRHDPLRKPVEQHPPQH